MNFQQEIIQIDNPYIIQNPYDSNELAAYVSFTYPEAVTYEYTVNGDIPFTYSNDEATNEVIIPVVGLYNDTINTIDIALKKGEEVVEKTKVEISTKDTSIDNKIATADINAGNESELETFMNGKVIIDNYTNIYDANGDLRANRIAPDSDYAYLKAYNNQFLVPDKNTPRSTYKTLLLSYSLTGRINPDVYYKAPMGNKFHHDMVTVDDKLYTLTSPVQKFSRFNNSYKESLITVYDSEGNMERTIDLSDFYKVEDEDLVNIGAGSDDIHLNSLDYYEDGDLLIVNSRSYSQIIGYNLKTDEVEWILDDPETVGEDHKELLLEPQGEMEYGSGEHTVFVANDYIPEGDKKDGMLYLSIFDNRQCVDADGKEMTKDLDSDADVPLCEETSDAFDSRGIIYEIDLENKTVSTNDVIDFTSRTSFKGGFNMLADQFKTTYVANAHNFEIYNPENEWIGTYVLKTTEDESEPGNEEVSFLYRAIALGKEELDNFVTINN